MICYVCGRKMFPLCSKEFQTRNLKVCEYVKCPDCGLVLAKTIYDMPPSQYSDLNAEIHIPKQGIDEDSDDPHWIKRINAQKDMLVSIFRSGLFSMDKKCVDYGCGDGRLADYVNRELSGDITSETSLSDNDNSTSLAILKKYDKYLDLDRPDYLTDAEMSATKFDLVLSSAVLEHLRGKGELLEVLSFLNEDGIFAFHTLICEEVPHDPEWFYYLSTHCTFYSNEAMSRLYNEFGFNGCIYNVDAQMWFCFRNRSLYEQFRQKKSSLSGTLVFGDGFVDYWKNYPSRNNP
ncbi:methyltransferase domain-containing protein [Butyrivibrio sp. MB2005]|uniref:methyltransferase domain-containing protein n=1 Tax=Butyrivibrio sp. MB2005 TaxID=1280678 RepID=UPI00041DA9FB|nr:methyltransferase domain-containing protein [Butyrivibrio sp. MB2005]